MANNTNSAMENLFQAIDIIVGDRLASLNYDKTIKVTIIDDSQSSKGIYVVSDGATEFNAICNPDVVYTKGAIVYVVVPEGDWNNEKLIVGRYSNNGDDYFNYANTNDDFLDVTHNLIADVKSGSLLANDVGRPYTRIWSADNLDYKGYNRLSIKGNFRTWLSALDVMKGSYGLCLYVVSKEVSNGNNYERTFKFDLLSEEMYGNPFNFETYYLQEKVFDISNITDICYMELLLVQNSDFYDTENVLVPYKNEKGELLSDNIFVKDPYISLGYDLSKVTGDEVKLYTLDSETYDSTNPTTKTMNVRWIHMQEDDTVIAIDKEEEIPANSVIRWYQYILDRTVTDKLAGVFWKEIEEARNQFTYQYTFTPDNSLRSEQFKVIVECPSRESIIASLTETHLKEYSGHVFDDKYLGDSEGVKFLEEETEKLDVKVLTRALNSYNRNDYLSFQEYKQVIEEYNANYSQAHNGVSYDVNNGGQEYLTASDILSTIQREMSNVKTYSSEILEFENESYDPVASAIDLISGLEILVDPTNYNGSYLLYSDSGMITNAAEATRKRVMVASYESLITGETTLDTAEKICWYIPLEGTMIYPPQVGTEYSKYEAYSVLTEEELKTFEFPCAYCRIERDFPTAEGDAGELLARQAEQVFRIKDYYTQTATNNTVYCTVIKNGKTYTASANLAFGIAGTNGTDATFLLEMYEMDGDKVTENPATAVTLNTNGVVIKPKFFDYNNNDITDTYLSKHVVTYSWYKSSPDEGLRKTEIANDKGIKYCRITPNSTDLAKCQYYILAATVQWAVVKYQRDENGDFILDASGNPIPEEADNGDIESRDVVLKTFLPIPVRQSAEYSQVVGPTKIIYDTTGANPTCYNAPFVMYKNGVEFTSTRWMSACYEYTKSGDSVVLNYYPSVDFETGKLTPKNMYLTGTDGRFAVECLDTTLEPPKIIWTQPILIIQNKYSSAMLNSWDGEFYIDEENGTIMSTMVGAGFKDVNNTFSGVLMGDVQGGASVAVDKDCGVGVYGFHQGEQSFGFNIKGTAFIGKSGRGRIYFDGNNGTIQSGAFRKPDKAEKGAEGAGAGMLIDLDGDDNSTGKGSFSSALFAYGEGGSFELNTRGGKSLLEIRSGPYTDSGVLIHIGNTTNKDFYIQSYDFNRTNKVGTRFDLETGTYESYHGAEGKKSWVKIDPKGSDGYFIIHDAGRENENIFHCSSSTFYLQSVNYKEKDTGMKIDLRAGTIDARAGYIGGWEITKSQLKAGNIIIDSAGSISATGDAGAWSIKSDGSATFTQISITGDKVSNIGPFIVSTTALTYTSGTMVFKLSTDGLSLNGNAFTVGLDGTTYIAGDLTVAGNAHLTGYMKTGEGGSFSNGGAGGAGFYNFGTDVANIGPWTIDTEAIYTGDGTSASSSYLGATGTLRLATEAGRFEVGSSGLKLVNGSTETFTINDGLEYINGKGVFKVNDSSTRIGVNDNDALLSMTPSYIWLSSCGDGGSVGYLELRSSGTGAKLVGGGGGSGCRVELSSDKAVLGVNGESTAIVLQSGDCKIAANDSTYLQLTTDKILIDGKTCKQDKTVKIRWLFSKGGTLKFHKGLLVTEDGDVDDEDATKIELDVPLEVSGTISAYPPDSSTLTPLGKLAFLDEVVIDKANFKMGAGTLASLGTPTSTIDGDTATYSISLANDTYFKKSGNTTTYYKGNGGSVSYVTGSSTRYIYADGSTGSSSKDSVGSYKTYSFASGNLRGNSVNVPNYTEMTDFEATITVKAQKAES